ncbi:hypothetical protein L6452_04193 [Arctium lappa]|uniref:Uncharacterized protein n=1 Tax=Arctium lappa TaxID=4217 RepID=A0ACB9FP95_ARCLA|nr:hypothetical protein L6452_04193 [Arctium lappa]
MASKILETLEHQKGETVSGQETGGAAKWEKITYVGIVACSVLAFVNLSKGHPHFDESSNLIDGLRITEYEGTFLKGWAFLLRVFITPGIIHRLTLLWRSLHLQSFPPNVTLNLHRLTLLGAHASIFMIFSNLRFKPASLNAKLDLKTPSSLHLYDLNPGMQHPPIGSRKSLRSMEQKIPVAVDKGEESKYLFSMDIIVAISKYKKEVAETVIEKAKRLCKHLQNVSEGGCEGGARDPRDVICETGDKMAVDMVVLSSHGYGLIKREQCKIGGYDIPIKMKVIINAWACSTDLEFWEDPKSFRPERFENTSVNFKGTNYHYIPFGSGRRMCPGITFGLVSVELFLAQMLYNFDWKLADGSNPLDIDMIGNFSQHLQQKRFTYI